MIELREAGPDDSELAYSVKRAAFRDYVEQIWGWSEEEQRRLHDQRFGFHHFQIIRAGGADVGVLATSLSADFVSVHQLFIVPEHQGKGIGRQCMRRVMDAAAALRLPVCLRVLKINPRARVFYERLGFVCTEETTTHHLMRWTPLPKDGREGDSTEVQRPPDIAMNPAGGSGRDQ
jgi:GNAT superfamily N-acetyltransferase